MIEIAIPNWLTWPDYSALTAVDYLIYFLVGVAGCLIRLQAMHAGAIKAPWRDEQGVWHMGVVGDLVTSVAAATLADHNLAFAMMAAVGAPFIVDGLLRFFPWMVRAILKVPPAEAGK
jgi:hypothetical protein